MNPNLVTRRPVARWTAATVCLIAIGWLYMGACASSSSSTSANGVTPMGGMSMAPPSPDPRIGLAPGRTDAGVAAWNMRLVSNTPPSEQFAGVTNSDLAFTGNHAIQGNYNGYQVWDISNPERPSLVTAYLCPASQSDVSIFGNVLFVSGEGQSGRKDCGTQGVEDSVSTDRLRGIRVFDATDIRNPKYIANVQTCRGSHTHTVVSDPDDPANVYIYVSGSARVRSPSELPGCSELAPSADPNSALFRIEVIRVPLAAPQQAAIVSSPRIFNDLAAPPRHADPPDPDRPARGGRGGRGGDRVRTGPTQCHDITVYPAIGLAGGACGGYGLLLDISDVANPRRIAAVADSNMSFWHSATFSNDGSKILFTDEWGGGSQPRCRATDKYEWGANALFTLENNQMEFKSYYKMPAAQTSFENCVAHNGSLIPIPGREVMVQGWYQGGISVFDWTDPANPKEIAFFDRGPIDTTRLVSAGSWSVYWYNGHMISSEIARGLDIFELLPSAHLSQNEIDAARTVHLDQLNAQEQPELVWPPSFPLARAYVDQLARSNGLAAARVSAARDGLSRAESLSGQQRRDALNSLATQLDGDARGSSNQAKVRTLATAVRELASAQR
ncbi:MAG: LVIVD repeat-containing protein [Longimicrobiales bacterium]